jgi:hypothetical protein
MSSSLETLRQRVLDRLGHHYSVGNLRLDTLEHRAFEALAAESSAAIRSVLWDLPRWEWAAQVSCRRIVFAVHPAVAIELDDQPQTWTIGRSAGSDVVLLDPAVSRRHAQISVRAQRCIVRDLGSTNGLWLNGRRVKRTARLRPGDSLNFGGVLEAAVR